MNTTSNEFKMSIGLYYNIFTEKIAIDYEIMWSSIGQVFGYILVINYKSKTIFNTFVYYYSKPINIINTEKEFSRIN